MRKKIIKYVWTTLLSLFVMYFIIGKISKLEYLRWIQNCSLIYFNITVLLFGARLFRSNINLFASVIGSISIIGMLLIGDILALVVLPKEHFIEMDNKKVIIQISSGWEDTWVRVYERRFLIYKNPLDIKEKYFKGSYDPYEAGDYKLHKDIDKYLK